LCKNQRLVKGLLWKWQLKEIANVHWPRFAKWDEFRSCKGEQVRKSLTWYWVTPRIMPKGASVAWLY
jgi:hypothetical protein